MNYLWLGRKSLETDLQDKYWSNNSFLLTTSAFEGGLGETE